MIFIDTGAFLAQTVKRDQYHDDALLIRDRLEKGAFRLFTSNLVLAETLTLLGRRVSYRFAAEQARLIMTSDRLAVLRPDLDDDTAAVAVFEKYADAAVSFTDAVSCVLMRRHRLKRIFTFDRHFERMGFDLLKP